MLARSPSYEREHRNPGLLPSASFRTLYRAWRAPDDKLSADEAGSTLFRFFRSKHIADLRIIALIGVVLAGTGAVVIAPELVWNGAIKLAALLGITALANSSYIAIESALKIGGPLIGLGALLIGWAYRNASARLGVVDLFAAEISTLCRVGTIFDVGKLYVDLYGMPPQPVAVSSPAPKQPSQSESKEDYFPIFDKNAHDLQILEANVVRSISEFYTYMKATRDSLRVLNAAEMPKGSECRPPSADSPTHPWCAALVNVIFMLFLGYESARKAIDELIEFEPNAAESKMVILVTELTCYCFLIHYFAVDDLRHVRLALRRDDYRDIVQRLYEKVMAHHGKNQKYWERALHTAPELKRRYEDAFGEKLGEPPSG